MRTLAGTKKRLLRRNHAGGDFTFELVSGKSFRLSENAATSAVAQRLYDHLQDLGMVAQIAYLDTRLNRARTA